MAAGALVVAVVLQPVGGSGCFKGCHSPPLPPSLSAMAVSELTLAHRHLLSDPVPGTVPGT